ncbi:M28 family metallopeptidase [Ahniella affigens]|nr:M28 family peptidase [Ahniella affigens]
MPNCLRPVLSAMLSLIGPVCVAAPITDTVILDIHGRGAERVAEITSQPSVLWSAEFGNELLLGVSAESRAHWLTRADARPGPDGLSLDTLRVRDHVCTLHDPPPALDVVGGYEILRVEPHWSKLAFHPNLLGAKVPPSGIVSRERGNSGTAKAVLPTDPSVVSLLSQIDSERWFQTVSDLAEMNRNSYSAGLNTARDYIQTQFANAGLSTELAPYTLPGANCQPTNVNIELSNVVGKKLGNLWPNEWVVIGAHYDSRNSVRCDGTVNPQPGANDNASGCAGVIELARVFQNIPTARTMVFACFSGEEQGLVGSNRYVGALEASGELGNVQHMINLDMMGHAIDNTLSARIETTTTHANWLTFYGDRAATYAPELNLITSTATQAYSDHWYFLDRGIPAMFTWENGAGIYPHYHQSTDVPANMQRAQPLAAGILKMDAAVLADLVNIYGVFADQFE